MFSRAYNPVLQFLDENGKPIAGGTLNTFLAGTNTPVATFNDKEGQVPNPVSMPLDDSGCPADVWLKDATLYKFVVKDVFGVIKYIADFVDSLSGFSIPIMIVDDNWDALVDENGDNLEIDL